MYKLTPHVHLAPLITLAALAATTADVFWKEVGGGEELLGGCFEGALDLSPPIHHRLECVEEVRHNL